MKSVILIDNKYKWSTLRIESWHVYFKGGVWIDETFYEEQEACKIIARKFNEISNIDNLQLNNLINSFTGHFAIILRNDKITFAAVDKIRSIPIYYSQRSNRLFLSNSAAEIKSNLAIEDVDYDASLQFSMAGYTLGNQTLYKSLNQLIAGEYIVLQKESGNIRFQNYFKYFEQQTYLKSEEELLDELHIQTMTTFNKMVESLNGLPVFLPLSGGYDSRFILSLLKELKYDNITTYTYGIKGLWEVKRAKFIADKLKTKWIFIEFKPKSIRKNYHTSNRIDYYNYASGYNSAPHLAEYYALLELRKRNFIPDDAIIINGQSGDFTSGGHLPELLVNHGDDELNISLLTDSIIKKHFSLWQNKLDKENISQIANRITHLLGLDNVTKLSKDSFAKYYELFECQERQSKFVVNGQRAYEWLDYNWRLPFWSDELMNYWKKVPWEVKFGQKLLLTYFEKHNFGGVFNNIQLPPQYSYYPFLIKMLRPPLSIATKLVQNDVDFQQKYFKYFMSNAPYYPHLKFKDFIKDSQWHRNPVSYWVNDILEELYLTNTNSN
jgi:asparagine synthase (glutamine-hydrolysing)